MRKSNLQIVMPGMVGMAGTRCYAIYRFAHKVQQLLALDRVPILRGEMPLGVKAETVVFLHVLAERAERVDWAKVEMVVNQPFPVVLGKMEVMGPEERQA